MITITYVDYALICIIFAVMIWDTYAKMVVEKFLIEWVIIGSISISSYYANKKKNFKISEPIKQFHKTTNSCIVVRTNEFENKFKDFKKKFHETFRDLTDFDKDLPNYQEEFAELITELLLSEHDTSKINIMGFTEFHTNVFLLKQFIKEMFENQDTRKDKEMSELYLISNHQIITFFKEIYLNRPNNKLNSTYDAGTLSNLPESDLRKLFKKVIIYDKSFGLAHYMTTFIDLLINYISILEKLIINKDDNQAKEEMNTLKDLVKSTYDNNTKIFDLWNKQENNRYINYNKILKKIKKSNDSGKQGDTKFILNSLFTSLFQDLDKQIINNAEFKYNCKLVDIRHMQSSSSIDVSSSSVDDRTYWQQYTETNNIAIM